MGDESKQASILGAWGPAVAWCLAIFWASSVHQPPPIVSAFPLEDKLLHGLVYAILALLFFRALRLRSFAISLPAVPWMAFALASFYGLTDEVHQRFVVGREASLGDWVADSAGALAGVLFVIRRKWYESRS